MTRFNAGKDAAATYIARLNDALVTLDDFDGQVGEKINNGQIMDPEALQLLVLSADIRDMINALISDAA